MVDYKQAILSHILDYLIFVKYRHKAKGKVVNLLCPFCKNYALTAHIVAQTHKIKCINPNCIRKGKKFTLISIVRRVEKDKAKWEAEKIIQYLKELFKVKALTPKDEEEINKWFDIYEKYGFSLVPVKRNDKECIEKDFQHKEHKDKKEWLEWISTGLNVSVRTGKASNLTGIDIDQKPIPEEIKRLLGNTLIEETTRGFHALYLLEEDLPKTQIGEFVLVDEDNKEHIIKNPNYPIKLGDKKSTIRKLNVGNKINIKINNEEKELTLRHCIKIDIENEGGLILIYPSSIDGIQRKFINNNSIIRMPQELKDYLSARIKKPISTTTASEQIKQEIINETYKRPLIEEGEGRHDLLFHYACILRKQMPSAEVESAIVSLNKIICSPPMDYKEIRNIMDSVVQYDLFDEKELANQILEYLRSVKEATSKDVERIIVGDTRLKAEEKRKIDTIIAYLKKEELIQQKSNKLFPIQKIEWTSNLVNVLKTLPFKIPYFYDLGRFCWGDILVIGAMPGVGKCISEGYLLTNQGFKDIKEIGYYHKEGISSVTKHTRIFSGKDKNKTYRHPNYFYKEKTNKTIKITTNFGFELEGTPEHPIKVLNSDNTIDFKELQNIKIDDQCVIMGGMNRFPKKRIKKIKMVKRGNINIDFKFDVNLAKLIGYIIGDGNINGNTISIYQDRRYKEIVEEIKYLCSSLNIKPCIYKNSKYGIKININNAKLTNYIRSKCFCHWNKNNLKSPERIIPPIILQSSKEIQIAFIEGLFNCESSLRCFKSKTKSLEITMASEKLMKLLHLMLLNFGIISRLNVKKVKTYLHNTYWRIRLSAKQTYNFFTIFHPSKYKSIIIIPPIFEKHLKIRGKNQHTKTFLFIDSIKSTNQINEKKYVYDFNIENKKYNTNNQFWSNGFISHNTHVAMNIIKQLTEQGIFSHYISLETGSRHVEIALQLGLTEKDFAYNKQYYNPMEVELEKNAVTIIDWLNPTQFKDTHLIFEHFAKQLCKHGGLLIVFVQLKENGQFFAPNLMNIFPALTLKYFYDKDSDGASGYFEICKIRESIRKKRLVKIPCVFNWDTKELIRVDELKESKQPLEEEQELEDGREEE